MKERKLVAFMIAEIVLAGAVVALAGAMLLRPGAVRVLRSLLLIALGVMMSGFGGLKFFVTAAHSRHPRRQRAWAVLELLFAAYLVVLAIRYV